MLADEDEEVQEFYDEVLRARYEIQPSWEDFYTRFQRDSLPGWNGQSKLDRRFHSVLEKGEKVYVSERKKQIEEANTKVQQEMSQLKEELLQVQEKFRKKCLSLETSFWHRFRSAIIGEYSRLLYGPFQAPRRSEFRKKSKVQLRKESAVKTRLETLRYWQRMIHIRGERCWSRALRKELERRPGRIDINTCRRALSFDKSDYIKDEIERLLKKESKLVGGRKGIHPYEDY